MDDTDDTDNAEYADGITKLDSLAHTLKSDFQNVWNSANIKPERLQNMALFGCFDLDFIALPHMKIRKDQFKRAVNELRMRFVDPGRSDYLLQQAYQPTVPADGLELYMKNIWVRTKNSFGRARLN